MKIIRVIANGSGQTSASMAKTDVASCGWSHTMDFSLLFTENQMWAAGSGNAASGCFSQKEFDSVKFDENY